MSIRQDDSLEQRAERMEMLIRTYFEGCNEANEKKMQACFTDEAVHYFPPGMYGGTWRGAEAISRGWIEFVESVGSRWTIDRLICDPAAHQAVIEWSHWKVKQGKVLRGDEWYLFDDETGLISEIRAYYASPADPSYETLELEGFDYEARGYAMSPPE